MSRMRKPILPFIVVVLLIAAQLATVLPTYAFPGDERDERCAELLAQAEAVTHAELSTLNVGVSGTTTSEANSTVSNPYADLPEDCAPHTGMTAIQLRAAEAEMAKHPTPDVVQVPYDEDVVWTRAYRRLNGDITIYDAPNGNPIGSLSAGYNFVTAVSYEGGWVQINYGQWVPEEQVTFADVSEFSGVEIQEQPERPFAWMLAEAYPSRYPGGPEDKEAEKIERYSLMNIYGVEYVDGWEWYLVGPDEWVQQIRVAKVQPIKRPEGIGLDEKWVAIDLFEQTMVAYQGDKMVFATIISSGLALWSTPQGLFHIYDRFENTRMSGAAGQPDFYFIEEVPYVMYFDGDVALHGTYWHDRFGYRQSHGCVNLSIMDAGWLYKWTEDAPTAAVYVYISGIYRSDLPAWARR
ncbi:MAG TPA: L,D-transpeptidase [Aggregatilinea sp.]|uniref:L,D-transpeptidase n=1 Tax=Aggregatilinea sp. TaxID=2806333 RepID=UPI002C1608F5|nr:L,D-transpeptidase [Aggregatilinea sp.]HML20167.1 L,D-transpeptidase [Aggregatilinea sp.]